MKYKYRGKKNTPLKEEKRIIKYGLKKLSVGVVSCIIGCCIFLGPGVSVYAQSSWDTSGNVALGDTASEVNEARHSVKVSTSIDEKNRTVTYTIYFNANHENWSRPGIDAFLPNVIDVNSINITRDYKENGGIWLQQGKENLVEFDQGRTREAIWYTDTDNFNNRWNRIKDTGSDGTSELDKWKNEGKFSIYLHSWETNSTKQYKWTITAKLKEGLTALEVKEAPVVVGMSTWDRRWPRYVGTGPHDTDGDGYSDIRERYYGTAPENRDDQPTAAKLFDLRKPDQPVEVKDTNNLTPEEKEKVKDAIKAKNPTLSQDAKVEVGNDGTVTVIYSDQSKDELPGNEVVVEKPKTQAELNNVEKPDQPVEVKDTNNLTPEEKEKVKDAIKAKNPTLSQDAKVEVGNDGTVTVTYSDQSKDELPGNEVVVEKPKTQAELNNVEKPDQPVEVKDTNNLTPEEKEKVKDAIKAKNPTLSQDAKVEVGNDGTVTVTYSDQSKDELPGNEVVKEKEPTPVDPSTVDTDGDGLSDAKEAELGTNPNEKDTDHDGYTDKEEVDQGTNPLDANSKPVTPVDPSTVDTDGDGLSDAKEAELGTNPNEKDTDHDGYTDKEEVDQGTNPLDANSKPVTPVDPSTVDTDGDGLSDAKEAELGTNPNEKDTDHDGYTDKEEVDQGTNPLDASSKPITKKPVVISGADTVRKQSKLPQTGDATNIFGYVGTLLASAGALIGIGKKKEDEVE